MRGGYKMQFLSVLECGVPKDTVVDRTHSAPPLVSQAELEDRWRAFRAVLGASKEAPAAGAGAGKEKPTTNPTLAGLFSKKKPLTVVSPMTLLNAQSKVQKALASTTAISGDAAMVSLGSRR